MFHLNTVLTVFLGLSIIAYVSVRCYFAWRYQYWRKRKVPHLHPQFPYGVAANPFRMKEKGGTFVRQIYNEMKSKGWKHGGFFVFATPVYLIVDLDYAKNVISKHFEHFDERGFYYNEKNDPLSAYLLNLGGTQWAALRKKLNPTFTSNKIKMMFQPLNSCVESLMNKLEVDFNRDKTINAYKTFTGFTIDVICSCALGLNCNIFKKENFIFRSQAEKFIAWSKCKWVVQILSSINVNLAKKLGIRLVPEKVSKFFLNVVKKNIKYREENNYIRNDFMQLLINLKNSDTDSLTITEVAAQCFLFFLAGYETSASTLTFCLFELAKNKDIQEKVRSEINEIFSEHGILTYDSLHELKYLEQVINETLRMYPPGTFLTRQCSKDYQVPEENVTIEKGTFVVFSVLGVHYDEEYYPDPEVFNPDRFTKENKKLRHPYTHLPFGEGPRICIGKRFAMIQIKLCLALILKTYKFTVNNATKDPLTMRTDTILLAPKDDILLNLQKI